MLKNNILYVYADGSSIPKPRRGGVGVCYVQVDNSGNEIKTDGDFFGYENGTNNEMELKAVIEGLKNISKQNFAFSFNLIEVRTDSRYVVDNKNNAIYNWSKSGWLNANGKPVENAPLWKDLIKVLKSLGKKVEFKWVKGHAKDEYNKVVDRLAKQSAKAYLNDPLVVTKLRRKKPGSSTKLGSIGMKGQPISIYVVNDSYLRLQGISKYRCQVISKASEYYKNMDFIYSELHHLKSGHSYRVVLNSIQKNPRILSVKREIVKK